MFPFRDASGVSLKRLNRRYSAQNRVPGAFPTSSVVAGEPDSRLLVGERSPRLACWSTSKHPSGSDCPSVASQRLVAPATSLSPTFRSGHIATVAPAARSFCFRGERHFSHCSWANAADHPRADAVQRRLGGLCWRHVDDDSLGAVCAGTCLPGARRVRRVIWSRSGARDTRPGANASRGGARPGTSD